MSIDGNNRADGRQREEATTACRFTDMTPGKGQKKLQGSYEEV